MNICFTRIFTTAQFCRFRFQKCFIPSYNYLPQVKICSSTPQFFNKQAKCESNLKGNNPQNATTNESDGGSKNKKESPKITLIGQNNSMTVTSLEEAEKLSRRRDLKLVKVQDFDTKTQRPVYKLLTAAELLKLETTEESKSKSSSSTKGDKNLTLGSKITDHDLSSRLKNISKWLKKNYEVRVLIQCEMDNVQNGEKIYGKIDTFIKEENSGRIVQKRIKNNNIKFNILPIVLKEPS